jgi:hypothetical protein
MSVEREDAIMHIGVCGAFHKRLFSPTAHMFHEFLPIDM